MKRITVLLSVLVVGATSNEKWSWGQSEYSGTREGKSSPSKFIFNDNTDNSQATLKSLLDPIPEEKNIQTVRKQENIQSLPAKQDNIRASFSRKSGTVEASASRQSRKIDDSKSKVSGDASYAQGDGQTEARFSKFKKGMCKYGIGINCPKGFDYIEVEEPYVEVPTGYGQEYAGAYSDGGYGVGGGGYGAPYEAAAGLGQYGGGISPHQVLQVQPVALQAVGTPIAAVPIGPGGALGGATYGGGASASLVHGGGVIGGQGGYGGIGYGGGQGGFVGGSGGFAQPGYGGVSGGFAQPGHGSVSGGIAQPGYGGVSGGFGGGHGGPAISSGPIQSGAYTDPSASYGAPPAQAYEVYSPPGHSGIDELVYASGPHDASIEQLIDAKPQVVNHYHTHTHIHQGASGSYGKDDSPYSGSRVIESINDSPPKRHTSSLIDPHPTFENSFDRNDCECVPNYFCPSSDVVGRSREAPLIDARNKKTDILSSATDSAKTPKVKRDLHTSFQVYNDTVGIQAHGTSRIRRQAHGTSRIRNTRQSSSQECKRGEVCCKNPGGSRSRELSYSCGKKNAAGVLGRVKSTVIRQTGDTQFGEYPWQAAILKREAGEVIYVCGGALVNDKHIITAAHCVHNMLPNELKVRLGEWDVNRKSEFYDHIEVNVQKIVTHPTFYSGTLQNDIAVVVLENDVQFSKYPHINPICLPNPKSDFMDKHCHVTGWGKDAFGSDGEFQYVLKEVEVPVWEHRKCEHALRQTRLGKSYELDNGMLCAGGEEGKDACKGDGGGPLVCPGMDGSMELGGIVSWGIGCGERGIPGVYVNIPHYMDWITKVLNTS